MGMRVTGMVRHGATACLVGLGLLAGLPGTADAQAMAMGGSMVRGTVTAATADHLTMKTEAGEVYEVVVSANTQVRKGRDQVKMADVHPGDGVGAMGEVDAPKKTVHALFLMVVDAEQIKKAREAMGKTMISGTVTAIDEVKLTIKRTDDVVQVIQVDEDTSFRKGGRGMAMMLGADAGMGGGGQGRGQRAGAAAAPAADGGESVTLADVKVGNVVAGPGTIKNGVFVPTQLTIGDPAAQQRQRRPRDGAVPGTGAPGAGAPATTPPTEPKS